MSVEIFVLWGILFLLCFVVLASLALGLYFAYKAYQNFYFDSLE